MTKPFIDDNIWELHNFKIFDDRYIVERIFHYNSLEDNKYISALSGIALPEKKIKNLINQDLVEIFIKNEIPIIKKEVTITGEYWSIDLNYARLYAKQKNINL